MATLNLTRRQLLELLGASSTLNFIPGVVRATTDDGRSQEKPKLRAVIRLQFYAGIDPKMSCDPPSQAYDAVDRSGKEAWLKQWNFPPGVIVGRGAGGRFGNNRGANADQALRMQDHVKNKIGEEFFCNPNKGLRYPVKQKEGGGTVELKPGETQKSSTPEFRPISPEVGETGTTPFRILEEDYPFTKVKADLNPHIGFGPLMHQFLESIPAKPGTSTTTSTEGSTPANTETYLDYMTVINGIDTKGNVSHDQGAVIAACGYPAPGVGNGRDLRTVEYKSTIEAIMAHELLRDANAFSPGSLPGSSFVPFLTFTHPTLRRGYSHAANDAKQAVMFDVKSLSDLDLKTKITSSNKMSDVALNNILTQLNSKASESKSVKSMFEDFKSIVNSGGLQLDQYTDAEKEAFNGMVETKLTRFDQTPDVKIPKANFFTNTDRRTGITDFREESKQNDIRLNLDSAVEGTWQNNLATTAMLVKRGMTRGANISFGGHSGFIPDSHQQNDYAQMIYQGQFWDGVKRLINYLKWNNDESGKPLIDSTLLVITADINRGPVYFDAAPSGTSDFRNNSLILIGGGLKHKTQSGTSFFPGRKFGYSHSGLESGRVDFTTGGDLEKPAQPNNRSDRPDAMLTFPVLYRSLLEAYGMDADKWFKDENTFKPLAENKPKVS